MSKSTKSQLERIIDTALQKSELNSGTKFIEDLRLSLGEDVKKWADAAEYLASTETYWYGLDCQRECLRILRAAGSQGPSDPLHEHLEKFASTALMFADWDAAESYALELKDYELMCLSAFEKGAPQEYILKIFENTFRARGKFDWERHNLPGTRLQEKFGRIVSMKDLADHYDIVAHDVENAARLHLELIFHQRLATDKEILKSIEWLNRVAKHRGFHEQLKKIIL